MTINEHIQEFGGLPVLEYSPEEGLEDAGSFAIRLALGWEAADSGETFAELFSAFVDEPECTEVTALVIGDWGGAGQGDGSEPVIEALVNARDRLPKLRALFLGEIIVEESEISWINQSDVSPLFAAFPNLEELSLRGGNGLSLGRPRHPRLRKLTIETGGMPSTIIREVASADLPKLKRLELWLGDDGYGNDVTTEDLQALLAAPCVQNLNYLGLRNDCKADETAKVLAATGISKSVKALDLSLGTLGDDGAAAILRSPWLRQLEKLDIHHHYVSPAVVSQIKSAIPEVDASDEQEPDMWDGEPHRYVAVSE